MQWPSCVGTCKLTRSAGCGLKSLTACTERQSLWCPVVLPLQEEREVADGDGVTVLNNQITCRIL